MSLVRTGFGIAHSGGRRQFRRGSTLLMVPAIVLLVAFYLLPNVLNLLLGLTNWNAFKSDTKFVGLGNFQTLADTNVLSNAVVTTLLFAAAAMVLVNVLGLAFALGLERTTRSNGVLRTLFLIPVLISPVAAGFVARGLLAPEGPVNAALSSVLGGTVDIAWFGSTDYTLYVLVFVQVWKSLGVVMLIYLAGLMAIPAELVEAARVDGATARQVITKVKLPLLGAALTANVVLSLIGGIGAFDLVLATTNGGPARSTAVINIVLYKFFSQGLFGMATAVNLVVFAMVVVASVPLIVYLRRRETSL